MATMEWPPWNGHHGTTDSFTPVNHSMVVVFLILCLRIILAKQGASLESENSGDALIMTF